MHVVPTGTAPFRNLLFQRERRFLWPPPCRGDTATLRLSKDRRSETHLLTCMGRAFSRWERGYGGRRVPFPSGVPRRGGRRRSGRPMFPIARTSRGHGIGETLLGGPQVRGGFDGVGIDVQHVTRQISDHRPIAGCLRRVDLIEQPLNSTLYSLARHDVGGSYKASVPARRPGGTWHLLSNRGLTRVQISLAIGRKTLTMSRGRQHSDRARRCQNHR